MSAISRDRALNPDMHKVRPSPRRPKPEDDSMNRTFGVLIALFVGAAAAVLIF